ncbi:MAG: hypothetical protein AABZ33_01705 [Chloroflexota bacterium]
MERDQGGGSDYGRDLERELGDEPAPAWRDSPPDILSPIDPNAPVSGHVAPRPASSSAPAAPEHDWEAASGMIFPAFRPVGTAGLRVEEIDQARLLAEVAKSHAQPIVDEGPCGLAVVYALHAGAYDVIVNGDHLLSWNVGPEEIQDAAMRNLEAWAAGAAWIEEASGDRRLLSSDTGDGWDASRILVAGAREHLADQLGRDGRVLVGLPDQHLLVAGTLRPDDPDFATLFADFIVEQSGGADMPIDRRVFELVDGRLVEFAG